MDNTIEYLRSKLSNRWNERSEHAKLTLTYGENNEFVIGQAQYQDVINTLSPVVKRFS